MRNILLIVILAFLAIVFMMGRGERSTKAVDEGTGRVLSLDRSAETKTIAEIEREKELAKDQTREFRVGRKVRYKSSLPVNISAQIRTKSGLYPTYFSPTGGKWRTLTLPTPRDVIVTLPGIYFEDGTFVVESIN